MVVSPLYGIPERGLHWYLTYLDHHLHTPGMKKTRMNPCLPNKRYGSGAFIGMVILQVDDTFSIGTKSFMGEEEASGR